MGRDLPKWEMQEISVLQHCVVVDPQAKEMSGESPITRCVLVQKEEHGGGQGVPFGTSTARACLCYPMGGTNAMR